MTPRINKEWADKLKAKMDAKTPEYWRSLGPWRQTRLSVFIGAIKRIFRRY